MDNATIARIEFGVRLLQREVHTLARNKGWYDTGARSVPELLALVHSEISEALEAYRELPYGAPVDTITFREDGKPEGIGPELADAVIRILDMADYLGIDLASIIIRKHQFNATRPHRHGGKRA